MNILQQQGFGWNDHTVGVLRLLWAEGQSTAEIGRRLGTSRNSVIGKAARLDLPKRPSPIKRASSAAPQSGPRRLPVPTLADMMPLQALAPVMDGLEVATPPAPPRIKPVTRSRHMLLAPASKQCCWPIGEPGTAEFRYCNEPALPRKPYCQDHVRSAYVPRQHASTAA